MLINSQYQKNGRGELYPFYHFELYSKPDGIYNYCGAYRLLVQPKPGEEFKLININAPGFDEDDFYYAARLLINQLNNKDSLSAQRGFLSLGKYLYPEAFAYKVELHEFVISDYVNGKTAPYQTKEILTVYAANK